MILEIFRLRAPRRTPARCAQDDSFGDGNYAPPTLAHQSAPRAGTIGFAGHPRRLLTIIPRIVEARGTQKGENRE